MITYNAFRKYDIPINVTLTQMNLLVPEIISIWKIWYSTCIPDNPRKCIGKNVSLHQKGYPKMC